MPAVGVCLLILAYILLAAFPAAGQTPLPGTSITNTACVNFIGANDTETTIFSNSVTVTIAAPSSLASLALWRHQPLAEDRASLVIAPTSFSVTGQTGGPFLPLGPPATLDGTSLDLVQPLPLSQTNLFHQGEAVFLTLLDSDQNLDAQAIEQVDLRITTSGSDQEILRLGETGPGTGMFAGYIQTVSGQTIQVGDGLLTVWNDCRIQVTYQDLTDSNDQAGATALIDPVSYVFDSRSGLPLDGMTVTLIDADTDQPALVLGNDGVSSFPAKLQTGGTAVDGAGRTYEFPTGGFRFPLVAAGTYRLEVAPSRGWQVPSAAGLAELQAGFGASYELAEPGSWGGTFVQAADDPWRLDVPADPVDTGLFVTLQASKSSVAVGEFIEFLVQVDNRAEDPVAELTIAAELPTGFRYRRGSFRLEGDRAADPLPDARGTDLIFTADGLDPGQRLELRFVAQATVAVRPGEARSLVRAFSEHATSNQASASLLVLDDPFSGKCLITGRLHWDYCLADSAGTGQDLAEQELAGVRIFLEDGTYAITDRQGRFHLAGVQPGAHVVQLDLATLPAGSAPGTCRPDPGRPEHPYTRLVDLQAGTTWQVDFPVHMKPRKIGRLDLDLASTLTQDQLVCRTTITGQDAPLGNLRLTLILPDSTAYQPGSSSLDGASLPDPTIRNQVLTYQLGDHIGDLSQTVVCQAMAPKTHMRASLTTQALLTFDGPEAPNQRSPVVTTTVKLVGEIRRHRQPPLVLHPSFTSLSTVLQDQDRRNLDSLVTSLLELEIVRIEICGHSDDLPIRPHPGVGFADNYELSLARAQSVQDYLATRLALQPDQWTVYGRGPSEPVTSNATSSGRAQNRRVTLQVWTQSVTHVLPADSVRDHHHLTCEVSGLRPGESWLLSSEPPAEILTADDFGETWVQTAPLGRELVWPPAGFLPAVPSLKLVVKHDPADSIDLRVGGQSVGPLHWTGTHANSEGTVALSRWSGVDLREGENLIEVIFYDSAGLEVGRAERLLHCAGPPAQARLVSVQSKLVADGIHNPLLAIRLTDQAGFPVRPGLVGHYDVAPPHAPDLADTLGNHLYLSGASSSRPTYVVGQNGMALIKLSPTEISGEATLILTLPQGEQEVRAWLAPEQQDWILVGLAEGTAGYRTVSDHLEDPATGLDNEEFHQDGRLAFFARGSVKGRWLLTMAYDSSNDEGSAERDLFQIIDPDAYYQVFADGSQQGHAAPSQEKLYIKLERGQFYALFGDFDTGLTVTELSRYSRNLTGFKSMWQGDRAGLTAFASSTDQRFVRDEIPGDGTSGLYRLSHDRIAAHSERVTIEVRDRYRSEVVLSSRHLTRFLDYEIDTVAGTIHFKKPVASQDSGFNPLIIVVDYETWDARSAAAIYGGRAEVRSSAETLKGGVTAVNEESNPAGGGHLLGVDASWEPTSSLRLRAEAARSEQDLTGRHTSWLAEMSRNTTSLQGRVYLREVQPGFGLGQLPGSEAGTRKKGLDLTWRLQNRWRATGTAYRQENLVTGSRREVIETRLNFSDRIWSAGLGLREAEDQLTGSTRQRTTQLNTTGSCRLWGGKISLNAGRQQKLGKGSGLKDFPTRTTLGTEVEILPRQRLFASQEFADQEGLTTRSTRIGVKAVPWQGGRIHTSQENRRTENESRVFANVGLQQSLRLSDRWSLDGGLDHGHTSDAAQADSTGGQIPTAIGPDQNFLAASLGSSCRGTNWLWNQRWEIRDAATGDKWGIDQRLFIEATGSVGLLGRIHLLRADEAGGSRQRAMILDLGLAWRPLEKGWVLLDRLKFKQEEMAAIPFSNESWRLINNLTTSWRPSATTQLALFHGAKYVEESIGGQLFTSFTDLFGVEARHDLGRSWDVGLQSSLRHSWQAKMIEYTTGASVGYLVMEDVWLSLGYNFSGFHEQDLSTGNYLAQGPFLRFRIRFNQESTHAMLR